LEANLQYPKLLKAFRQYGDWLQRLGISSVGELNDAIQNKRAREVILVSEAFHDFQVNDIARQIAARAEGSGEEKCHSEERCDAIFETEGRGANQPGRVRVVLISGPSSSGKTTFSKRLSVQLLALGVSPFALEMDNYFVDRDDTPRDQNGEFDFESLYALNIARLSDDLEALIAGKLVRLLCFIFKEGRSEPGEEVMLKSGELIILEGIHGLNPNLLPRFPASKTFRVYVSCLTQLNLDRQNRVSTTDTRLIRRIVRDARERGYSAQQTIQRWESVRRGEKNNIFPYQENADAMFNSALAYELSVLRPLVEPLLRQVPFGSPEFVEAKRLLSFLEWFLPIESEPIPDNSILKEFIGGSILRDFKLWSHAAS
jgi:uridine kinase